MYCAVLALTATFVVGHQDLTLRPHLSGRRTQGTLAAHVNGVRFTSTKKEYLDVLYSNIRVGRASLRRCYRQHLLVFSHPTQPNPTLWLLWRLPYLCQHAFLQPCDKEHVVLIHFHLKNPIIVGKKQHKDITYYTEVSAQCTLTPMCTCVWLCSNEAE